MSKAATRRINKTIRTFFRPLFLALVAGLFASQAAYAISERVIADVYTGIAIGGYDPVSYFADHVPRKGKRNYELVVDGVYWQFANIGNMEVFRDSPAIYQPAYGGHSAMAIAESRVVPGDPLVWVLLANRLYFFADVPERDEWLKDPQGYIRAADVKWQIEVKKLAAE